MYVIKLYVYRFSLFIKPATWYFTILYFSKYSLPIYNTHLESPKQETTSLTEGLPKFTINKK